MSAPANSEFIYQQLSNKRDLRLLRIDSVSEATLKCHLLAEPFEDASRRGYYALSYCWGDEPFSSEISIDGKPFFVKPNALRALKAVHRWLKNSGSLRKGECYVWIDAICINQNDNADKSMQVTRMDLVYLHALHTLIWLGAAEDDSDKVVDVISQAGWKLQQSKLSLKDHLSMSFKNLVNSRESDHQKRLAKQLENRHGIQKSRIIAFADLMEKIEIARPVPEHYQSLFARKDDPLPFPPQDAFWQSLMHLFSRPWFSRIWTFQEGVLSRNATVLCGESSIDWFFFREWRILLIDWLTRAVLAQQITIKEPPTSLMTATYNRELIGNGFEALQNILVFDVSTRHASVKKDFVYGYLGIIGQEYSDQITVDYSAPDWMIFAEAAKLVVEGPIGANSWSCMIDSFAIPADEQVDQLPSWCPDFSCRSINSSGIYYAGTELQGRMVRQDVVVQLSVADSAAVRNDLKMIKVPGYVVDIVDRTCDIVLATPPDAETWEQIWEQDDAPIVLEWLSAIGSMCSDTNLKYLECILSFFFEGTDATLNTMVPKTHQRPQRFQQLQKLLQQTADIRDIMELEQKFNDLNTESTTGVVGTEAAMTNLKQFVTDIRRPRIYNRGRHFFTTTAGRVGFSSQKVQQGQQVCYFSGSYNFKILSSIGSEFEPGSEFEHASASRYIGLASVEGIMDKELLRLCSESDRKKMFHIF